MQKGCGIDRTPPIRNQAEGGKRKIIVGEGLMGRPGLGNAWSLLKGQF